MKPSFNEQWEVLVIGIETIVNGMHSYPHINYTRLRFSTSIPLWSVFKKIKLKMHWLLNMIIIAEDHSKQPNKSRERIQGEKYKEIKPKNALH